MPSEEASEQARRLLALRANLSHVELVDARDSFRIENVHEFSAILVEVVLQLSLAISQTLGCEILESQYGLAAFHYPCLCNQQEERGV
jgi:hypothetical protein